MTSIAVYILVIITHVNSGATVSFQEFTSLSQCQKNAAWIDHHVHVREAYCTLK